MRSVVRSVLSCIRTRGAQGEGRAGRIAPAKMPKSRKSAEGPRARPKVVFLETTEMSLRSHLSGQAKFLQDSGFEVLLIGSDLGGLEDMGLDEGVRVVNLPMPRNPSPWRDSVALMVLTGILVQERPTLLVYGTPKAALLGAVAGTLTRAPVRVYVLHGLRLETLTGLRRGWMTGIEWFVMRLSTQWLR